MRKGIARGLETIDQKEQFCLLTPCCCLLRPSSGVRGHRNPETLKTCPGLEGIQRGCPSLCQLFVLIAEKMDMFWMLVLKLTVGIEPGHCVFKEVE
ncbi:hypothetical protein PMIT1323_01962 [Prochlorococcus marinus str. MIT 1323]|nr:hypothetical protein PMIT1323_01962 [Prochlorococcus marinus str. MIT 1323]